MGLDYSDTRPSYFNLLNLELRAECREHWAWARIFQNGWRIQLGSSGRNQGAAVEADASGEQQLKWTQLGNWGTAAEVGSSS